MLPKQEWSSMIYNLGTTVQMRLVSTLIISIITKY